MRHDAAMSPIPQIYTAVLMSANSTGSGEMVPDIPLVRGKPLEHEARQHTDGDGVRRLTVWSLVGTSSAPHLYEYAFENDGKDPTV